MKPNINIRSIVWGIKYGIWVGTRRENKRIVKLLEPLAEHNDYCVDGCYPEDCSAPSYEIALALVKGEQKW